MNKNLIKIIEERMHEFSKGQRLIGRYIIDHYDKAAFMTASKLGAAVGISESTVVRFATEMGYEGYPELQRNLQGLIRNRLTTIQRLEVTNEQMGDDVLTRVFNMDIERIRKTQEEVSKEDFLGTVDAIINAKCIYILGVRSAATLAKFMYFYFNQIFPNVKLVMAQSSGDLFEEVFRISDKDVFVAISFPRYSKRTIKAIDFVKQRGVKVVSITDSISSPIAENSDYTLLARSDTASFVDSLVAPLSLINALIVAIGLKKRDEIKEVYSQLESIWDEYDVYEKQDGNTDAR